MLSYVFNKLKISQPENGEHPDNQKDLEDEDDEEEITSSWAAQSTAGFLNQEFDKDNVGSVSNGTEQSVAVEVEDDPTYEVLKATGIITRLDPSMPKGVIDRTYYFEIQKFCSGRHEYSALDEVEFEAFRSRSNPAWTVTVMKPHVSKKQVELKERLRHKTIIARIVRIDKENIEVQWGDRKTQNIPNNKEILPPHHLKTGDWLKIHLEQLYEDEHPNMLSNADLGLAYDETMGKIISVEPNQQKIIVGKVTKTHGEFTVDDEIHFTLNVVKGTQNMIPIGTLVRCTAVDSSQTYGYNDFQWRATEITQSNFMQYTNDAHNRDEDGNFEDRTDELSMRLKDLYQDRFGVKIKPNWIKFQPIKLNNQVAKSVTVENTSGNTYVLHKIAFHRDQAVCRFELQLPHKEKDVVRTLGPGESYNFQVYCTPLQIGRTKELCVFDFGGFKIARDFIATGLAEDDNLINKIKKPDDGNHRPNYHKFRGEQDVGEVMKNLGRIRVRGSQPVRSPFFLPKRIPHYKVPVEIWEAFRQQNEGLIRNRFPGAIQALGFENYKVNFRDTLAAAIQSLTFENYKAMIRNTFPGAILALASKNYKEKFDVSLWFEEVDNDLRRRQYDIPNVRLHRAGENYTFKAPGIQDYHPPVLVSDPIDVFDPDDPSLVKYQGYIKKIQGEDVSADFSETFNQNYTGIPLTVQFCLGRMTYKRQHYAVEGAALLLGEKFLFPDKLVEIKEPRIPFYEDEGDSTTEDELVDPIITEDVEEPAEIGLFKKHQPKESYTKKSPGEKKSMRAQSLRTPFMSEATESKFTKDVQLKWRNKGLNTEQKDAVRRILRGQARPLPYIIYGPPGTGKTVTVVEAIMQVNILDPNSRILVTAPTNHAADVIAEYLVNSKMYNPGDFVRFNGFMRQEQLMSETIREYCMDGEFLDSVARSRLIVSTCTTAGQFFSLNLNPGHFTHVFVDEAGYCTEPESMIAAVNLAIGKGGQIILAGDPNQLGPVLMSDVAQNLDLNVSFLERLMKGRPGIPNLYGRDVELFKDNYGYNPLVLTKLVKNYRAHRSLLQLPSRLFYNDDLESCASYEEAYELTQNPEVIEKVLRSQGVPLVFHGVQGTSVRERDSPSWCNAAEVMQVVDYVRKLKVCGLGNDDIGIITPYRKQAEKLRMALQLGLFMDDIPKVGSVEEFQGGERKVVIISTVRSLYEDKIDSSINKLGFLYNEKRFNVAITRAKSLMIIVGNPHVLWKDKRWNDLLRYCLELRAYTGCNLPLEIDVVANELYKEMKAKEDFPIVQTLPPDMPTKNYNPDGECDEDFEDAEN